MSLGSRGTTDPGWRISAVLRLIGLAVCLTLPWIDNVSADEEPAPADPNDAQAVSAEAAPKAPPPRRWNAVESRWISRSEDASWSLFDLWVEAPIGNIGWLTVGKFKEPLSMERLMGGGFMPGIERTMGTDALTPSRNVGLQIGNHFANARMTWTAGVFNDWAFTGESFCSASPRCSTRGSSRQIR